MNPKNPKAMVGMVLESACDITSGDRLCEHIHTKPQITYFFSNTFFLTYSSSHTTKLYVTSCQQSNTAATMSDKTFNVTSEDLRKAEANESKYHGGQIPKDSDVSAMKVT